LGFENSDKYFVLDNIYCISTRDRDRDLQQFRILGPAAVANSFCSFFPTEDDKKKSSLALQKFTCFTFWTC
jgi:hypothetical protein